MYKKEAYFKDVSMEDLFDVIRLVDGSDDPIGDTELNSDLCDKTWVQVPHH